MLRERVHVPSVEAARGGVFANIRVSRPKGSHLHCEAALKPNRSCVAARRLDAVAARTERCSRVLLRCRQAETLSEMDRDATTLETSRLWRVNRTIRQLCRDRVRSPFSGLALTAAGLPDLGRGNRAEHRRLQGAVRGSPHRRRRQEQDLLRRRPSHGRRALDAQHRAHLRLLRARQERRDQGHARVRASAFGDS